MNSSKKVRRYFLVVTAGMLFLLSQAIVSPAQQALTIQKALEIAMENSPSIQTSKISLDRSKEQMKIQEAALKSSFSLSLSPFSLSQDNTFDTRYSDWYKSWTKSSGTTFTIAQPIKQTDGTFTLTNRLNWQDSFSGANNADIENKSFTNSLYLTFTQPIFTYNRTKLTLRNLELDIENSTIQYELQKLSLEKNVTQYFYNVYQDKSSLDIARDELTNQQASYEIIKNKVDAGLSAKDELYEAELTLASSKASVNNAVVTLENALDTFKQLIGVAVTDSISIDADIAYKPVEVVMERAIDHALKSRMELRQKDIDIETAKQNILTASAQNEFKGSISLSYGITGTDEDIGDMFQSPTKKQGVGITFDIPLWDWGEKKARIHAAELGVKSSELSLDTQKIDIVIAIRQAVRNMKNLVDQIEIAEQNVRNAQLTYEINLERYKTGNLTSMDLNLYQTQLSQKKISLTSAQINYKIALLNLKILTLWDYENNKSVVPELKW